MRLFAISDIHVDYDVNEKWVTGLSLADHQQDVLIVAGDVSDSRLLLERTLAALARRFRKVLFVPGNHDLWVLRDGPEKNSMQKFDEVGAVVEASGASMQPFRERGVSIIPLLGWYDYTFGEPSEELRSVWMDYRACRWPRGFAERDVAAYFEALNDKHLPPAADKVVTYSHFLPRIDVMPHFASAGRVLYPVLGSRHIDRQLRKLGSTLHVYGHSHVNRRVTIDGVTYVNNAFGYPSESFIASKRLVCIHEW